MNNLGDSICPDIIHSLLVVQPSANAHASTKRKKINQYNKYKYSIEISLLIQHSMPDIIIGFGRLGANKCSIWNKYLIFYFGLIEEKHTHS